MCVRFRFIYLRTVLSLISITILQEYFVFEIFENNADKLKKSAHSLSRNLSYYFTLVLIELPGENYIPYSLQSLWKTYKLCLETQKLLMTNMYLYYSKVSDIWELQCCLVAHHLLVLISWASSILSL